jgi:hypothetical protein
VAASGHRELERAGGEAREREAGEHPLERAGHGGRGAARRVGEPDGAGLGVVPEHGARDDRHDPRFLNWAALGLFTLAAVVGWASFSTYPQYDSLYAFVWAREIWDGGLPGFDAYRAPTEHPLLLPVGLALAPFGDAGLRAFVLVDVLSFVALVAAVWRLGRAAAGVLGAVLAAALIASRLNFSLLAAIGFLDIPYCALIAWACVLAVEHGPRRATRVFALLALAGLLRPEAWLLAGLFAVWCGWRASWAERIRFAALAAIAPVLWSLVDLVVTGDPLFSLLHTDGLALELQRERPLSSLPWLSVRLLAEVLKWPVLVLGVTGIGVAVWRGRRDLAVVAALIPVTLFTYFVIASGGLPTVYRYLLVAAIALAVFAAYALAGWTGLERGRLRTGWALLSVLLLLGGAAFTVLNTSPKKVVRELEQRERIRADLRDLLAREQFKRVAACGPITVPNHKLVPEIRWLLDLPDGRVRARSDRTLGVQRSGAAIVIERRIERRPALDIGEVPRDGGRAIQQPPPGFELLGGNRSFAIYGACP